MLDSEIIIIFIGAFGLIAGSFVNALIWRVREQSKHTSSKDLSIINGRSICPNCKHKLASIDLIPVISWLSLRGKCRYCHKSISSQYPLVELAMAILFILSYAFWPQPVSGIEAVEFAIWLVLLTGLFALFIYDLKWQILPSRILYPLLAIAALLALINIINSGEPFTALVSLFFSVLIGGGLFFVIYQVSGGKWIGGGDVRLGWLLGLIAGTPAKSVLVIFLAAILGSLLSIPLLATKRLKRTSTLPFGPFLITGLILVEFFGTQIVNWYFNLLVKY
jgi:leader peptidase (prepilin peptidase)/N-methyltransferase